MPDDLDLPPDEALIEAQRLLDADRPFHAHEVLEAVWKAAPEPERELWRGLAQVAVGITHLRRGNPRGAHALLSRAADRLEPYAANPPHNIDVPGIIATTRSLATTALQPKAATAAGSTTQPAESATEPTEANSGPAETAAAAENAATARATAAEFTDAAATTEPAAQPAAGAEPSVGPGESSAGPGETTAEPATAAKAATAESAAAVADERDAAPEHNAARSTDSHEGRRDEAPSRADPRPGDARAKDGADAQGSPARRRDEAPSQADTKHETDAQGPHAQKYAIQLRLTR
jgi:hypothetical protein